MPYVSTPNYSKLVVRTLHATPTTIVLRPSPSPHNSMMRFPEVGDVRLGVIYGPGQYEQQEYLEGTLAAGGGSGVSRARAGSGLGS
jgi:hypothetical protein